MPQRRSPHDREITRLALPALGALAAEPLYLLVDTAIVGHLGTRELAALALAAAVLSVATTLCNFLAYGTTAQVARRHGAGEQAGEAAVQALWLALAIGAVLVALVLVLAGPAVALMGGEGETARLAERYLRISAAGLPMAMLALSGQGYLRGVGNLSRPLVIVAAAQAVNVVLELWFVYGLGWGLDGSAAGTVIAQAGMGAAFAWALLGAAGGAPLGPRPRELARMARIGGHLFVRTASLLAAFTVGSAVAARMGEPQLAAHQVAFQLFVFIALVLDAAAIAAQILIGRALGAGDAAAARAAGRRVIELSVLAATCAGGLLAAGHELIPRAFTSDPAVLAQAGELWWLFVAMQPLAGAVFALDGILIGAGDSRFLAWAMAAASAGVFVPLALAVLALDGGIAMLWLALVALMVARGAALGVRFASSRWQVLGELA